MLFLVHYSRTTDKLCAHQNDFICKQEIHSVARTLLSRERSQSLPWVGNVMNFSCQTETLTYFRGDDMHGRVGTLGPAYALGQSSFFKKYEKNNFEFFTWSWENDFGNLCPSLIAKIGYPFFQKNKPHFQETKVNFLFKVFLY